MNKIKQWLSKKGNLFFLALLAFVLWQRVPTIISNYGNEGKNIQQKEYLSIRPQAHGVKVMFPPAGHSIAFFWATWCAPCKVEMGRLRKSVDEKKLPGGKIFAINPFEDSITVRNFLQETPYPFTFLHAPDVSGLLNVSATPTTAFFKDGKLESLNTGMSLIGIWKAERFLSNP